MVPLPTTAAPALSDDLRSRLDALDIDVGCALRFARATVHALAAMSRDAREALDRCLGEEAAIARIEDLNGSEAVAAILDETRRQIRSAGRDDVQTAARDIERFLVERAADLSAPPQAAGPD